MEIWKPVVGWEWGYEVSSWGRVRSVDRVIKQKCRWGGHQYRNIKGKILSQHSSNQPESYGRMSVGLGSGTNWQSDRKTRLVHQLVMEAFVGPRPHGMECRHLDGNPKNNRLENLCYGTPKQNSGDKYLHGTVINGEKSKSSKLTEEQVREIKSLIGHETYDRISEKFGVSIAQISRIKTGKRWGHVG